MSDDSDDIDNTLCLDEENFKKVKSSKKKTLDDLTIKVMGNFLDNISGKNIGFEDKFAEFKERVYDRLEVIKNAMNLILKK